MKLNPDCMRDILVSIEETTDYYTMFEYLADDNKHPKLSKYSHDEIAYHIHQCNLAELIFDCHFHGNGAYITVDDLTPAGHEFLANTRQDSIWENTKEIAAKIGATSMGSLVQIAGSVVTEIIKNHFGFK